MWDRLNLPMLLFKEGKVSERSVVDMASKPTSRVAEPSKTFWSPPRTRTLWSTKVVPSTGTNVAT